MYTFMYNVHVHVLYAVDAVVSEFKVTLHVHVTCMSIYMFIFF